LELRTTFIKKCGWHTHIKISQQIFYVAIQSARKDTDRDFESEAEMPSEWQHGGQQPPTSFANPCAS
jgi:hypothetical protein